MTTTEISSKDRLLNRISTALNAAHTVASFLAMLFLVSVVVLDYFSDVPSMVEREDAIKYRYGLSDNIRLSSSTMNWYPQDDIAVRTAAR